MVYFRFVVREIKGQDGNPSGRYRWTATIADSNMRPVPLCACLGGHASPEEAESCEDARDHYARRYMPLSRSERNG
jgi:hypothetical protein